MALDKYGDILFFLLRFLAPDDDNHNNTNVHGDLPSKH